VSLDAKIEVDSLCVRGVRGVPILSAFDKAKVIVPLAIAVFVGLRMQSVPFRLLTPSAGVVLGRSALLHVHAVCGDVDAAPLQCQEHRGRNV
jgi:hypothetical protein